MSIVAIGIVALLWAFSGVLALAETAFTRVSRIRLLALEEEGEKRARRVLRLMEHPEKTLNSFELASSTPLLRPASVIFSYATSASFSSWTVFPP